MVNLNNLKQELFDTLKCFCNSERQSLFLKTHKHDTALWITNLPTVMIDETQIKWVLSQFNICIVENRNGKNWSLDLTSEGYKRLFIMEKRNSLIKLPTDEKWHRLYSLYRLLSQKCTLDNFNSNNILRSMIKAFSSSEKEIIILTQMWHEKIVKSIREKQSITVLMYDVVATFLLEIEREVYLVSTVLK